MSDETQENPPVQSNPASSELSPPSEPALPVVSDKIIIAEPPPAPAGPSGRPVISAGQIVQAFLLLLVVVGILKYIGVIPTARPGGGVAGSPPPLPPVRAGQIVPQFKVISVTREYGQPVKTKFSMPMPEFNKDGFVGRTAERLFNGVVPGTTEHLIYDMVTTVTAGIDLGKLGEGDITNDDLNSTITLPEPEILSISIDQQRSQILWHDKPTIPLQSESAKLLIETQKKGEQQVRREASRDAELMRMARMNAENSLRAFLQGTNPGRTVWFRYKDDIVTTAPVQLPPVPPS